MCIIRTKSPWVFEVEDLVTKNNVSEVDVSRLRFYVDKMLKVTDDLFSQVARSREGLEVKKFLEVRRDKSTARYDVRIK
jgi:hypothetical protein